MEAGQTLNAALMRESLVDELLVYLAPCLLGQGMDMFPFGPLSTLQDRIALEFRSTEPVGKDLRIVARVKGRDDF